MCVGGEDSGFVSAWIELNSSQRRKKVGIVKTENLMEKEDFFYKKEKRININARRNI